MENRRLNSKRISCLCKIYDVDLSLLKQDVPKEYWNEDCFLIDKCDFFMKCIRVDDDYVFKKCVYNEKLYQMDAFPTAIRMDKKFPQLEVFYTNDDRYGFNHLYFEEEKKCLSVLSKLWAYSSIFLESDIIPKVTLLPNEVLEDEKLKSIMQLFSKEDLTSIDDWKILRYLFSLSLKDYISVCIYFVELKIIIWLKGLCVTLYICDKEQENFVKTICMTEGLYLRNNVIYDD